MLYLVEVETLGEMKAGLKVTPRKPSVSAPRSRFSVSPPKMNPSPTSISTRTTTTSTTQSTATKEAVAVVGAPRRARTVPTASRTRKPSTTESATARPIVQQDNLLQVPDGETQQRPRSASSASHAGSSASGISSRSARTRAGSSASVSRPGLSISRAVSSPVPPPLPVSGTMSPELPGIHGKPITPVAMMKKRTGLSVLGLGTPEVERWIRAGKGDVEGKNNGDGKRKGKTVGFTEESESEGEDEERLRDLAEQRDSERHLAVQISPRKSNDVSAPVSTSWSSNSLHPPVSGSGSGSGAHDLLRTIVRDVMYDFQRETKAEMMGLHLDLVRMGRGWKKELRDLMGEYVGDLKDLREENRRLREENERLRRGY